MKNNTKLIVETWRRFLNEGDQNEEGQYSDPDETVPPLPPVEEDPDLVDDIKRIDSESEGEMSMEMNMPDEDFVDLPHALPHAGDDIEYSEEDARMTDEERAAAQEERDALSDPNFDEFGNEQENPFAYDDGPY